MIMDVLKSVKDTFATGAGLGSAYGVLYLNNVPPKTELPYARMFVVDLTPDHAMGRKVIEYADIQISLFHTSGTSLFNGMVNLKTAFDGASLSIANTTFIGIRRLRDRVMLEPSGVSKSGDPVYHAWIEYRITTSHSY